MQPPTVTTVTASACATAQVAAIGSRTLERAAAFARAQKLDVTTLHGTYEALAADETIDIVYIATPSFRHVSDSIACLSCGRAVLCEKSMATSFSEASRVIELARARGLFFSHGVWSRFFPVMTEIRRQIESGAIGEIRSVHASFCQNDGAGSCSAMSETGIYCVQFLLWVYGGVAPQVVGVQYSLHPETGQDEHVAALLRFPCGGIGSFECSLAHASPRTATICGTKGVIEVPFPFWCPTALTVQTMTGLGSQTFGEKLTITIPLPEIPGPFNFVNSQGLLYEAAEATRCILANEVEP